MRKSLLVVAAYALMVPTAFAQRYLPKSFAGWNAGGPATTGDALHQTAFEPGVLDEYGLKSQESQAYVQGSATLNVALYEMIDPTGAYGAFTYLHTPEMKPLGVTKFSVGLDDRALIVVGNFLMDATGPHISSKADDLRGLVAVLQPIADRRAFPYISEHFPEQGLIGGSERYIIGTWGLATFAPLANGDWVGFDQGAEVMLARYKRGGQDASLIVIEYPTQQIAAGHEDRIAKLANKVPGNGRPAIAVDRKANLISVAITENAAEYAQSLLQQIHFGHDVMWNEPSFKAKEPKLNVMVVGAFLGTGLILVLAIVTGFGFGLMRIVLKIFFPGKVFDRHRSIEIIQLGISGRSIDTKDLY